MSRARGHAAPRGGVLSLAHRTWIVANLRAGVAPDAIADALAAVLPAARARREVAAIAASPLLAVCDQLARRAAQLEQVAALARAHARAEPDATEVERRATIEPEAFYRHHWAAHRPVVLTGVIADWPALRRWTPAWLRARYGRRVVEVMTGRDGDPDHDARIDAHRTRMTLARFLDAITAGPTNDLYLVAHNRALRRPALRPLLADLRAPAGLLAPVAPATTSLWLGPAGTVTPLHHDTTSVLLCQVLGRKRVELIAPAETALLADARHGFWSPRAIDDLARAGDVLVKRTELGPGDALFLPAGWWHRVTALDVSISVGLIGFLRPNDVSWYAPGRLAPT